MVWLKNSGKTIKKVFVFKHINIICLIKSSYQLKLFYDPIKLFENIYWNVFARVFSCIFQVRLGEVRDMESSVLLEAPAGTRNRRKLILNYVKTNTLCGKIDQALKFYNFKPQTNSKTFNCILNVILLSLIDIIYLLLIYYTFLNHTLKLCYY